MTRLVIFDIKEYTIKITINHPISNKIIKIELFKLNPFLQSKKLK